MGAGCCNESKSDAAVISAPSAVSGSDAPVKQAAPPVVQKDLPSISLEGKDVFEKFELSLPFSRT